MKKNGALRIIIAVFLALAIAGAGFTAGYFTHKLTRSDSSAVYDWVLETVRGNYYQDVDENAVLNASLKSLTGGVLDKYSRFYTAEEYAAETAANAGSRAGIGVTYSFVDNFLGKGVYISKVLGNSPAYKSGLRAGTVVSAAIYGGERVEFNKRDDFSSFVTDRAEGESYTLKTDRGDYEIASASYTQSYCRLAVNSTAYGVVYSEAGMSVVEESERKIESLPDGAAYMSLSQFYGNAAYEMSRLVQKFNAHGCTSLVLDLRDNGGGYLSVLQEISCIFTANAENAYGVAATAIKKDGTRQVYPVFNKYAGESVLPANTPVYVLANNGTASASEALIGVLHSNGLTPYSSIFVSQYGEEYLEFSGTSDKNARTYGKGIMQQTFTMPGTGDALKLTTAKIYWPDGNCIHDVGLTVDMGCRAVPAVWSVTYDDEELMRVINTIYK